MLSAAPLRIEVCWHDNIHASVEEQILREIVDRVVLEYHSDALLAQVAALLHEHGFTPVLRVANVMGGNAGILYADKSGISA